MTNQIMTISPYKLHNTWVFDDYNYSLKAEPFVSGAPEVIDELVKDINNAESGFRLIFSLQPFPGYKAKLKWTNAEYNGNWYCWDTLKLNAWLCPALLCYFNIPPKLIYCKAESII